MKKAVLAIVVVAAVVVGAWYFMGPLNHARQKRTMADMRKTGTAMLAWLTDEVGVAPQGPAPAPHLEDLGNQKGHALLARAEQIPPVKLATLTLAAPTQQNIPSVDVASYKKRTAEEVEKLIVPRYMQELPKTDAWGHAYEYYLDSENPLAERVMLIRSPGRDGTFSGSVYQGGPFEPGNFHEDIVWTDGFFVRWPEAQPAAQ